MTLLIERNADLRPLNTFGVAASAECLVRVAREQDLIMAVEYALEQGLELTLLGGGSNVLLTRDVPGLTVLVQNRGIRVLEDDGDVAVIEAAAGEPWHPLVQHTLELGLRGLENLSLIPGTVGAAPIQNIGAYGVELRDVFAGLTAYDRKYGAVRDLAQEDCAFGYRDSLFKQEPDRWVVLRVRMRLSRTAPLNLDYGAIRQRLAQAGIREPAAQDVASAVCAIRMEKLPNPAVIGNAGSFFKNPVVDAAQAEAIRADHPDLVVFAQPDGRAKLAAGWLIDSAGWKGHREGDAGVHSEQALVLVNHGRARGADILSLAARIREDIVTRFGIELEAEPRVI